MNKTANQIADEVIEKLALSPGLIHKTFAKHVGNVARNNIKQFPMMNAKRMAEASVKQVGQKFPRAVNKLRR